MNPRDDLRNPVFLRELALRPSWGRDREHDKRIFEQFAQVLRVPPKTIVDAMIDWAIEQLRPRLPFHHSGNETVH